MVNINHSDVKQLVQKFICCNVSDRYNDKDFNKFVEADNVVTQLKYHFFDSAKENGFYKFIQRIIMVFDINGKYSIDQIKNTLKEVKNEVSDDLM